MRFATRCAGAALATAAFLAVGCDQSAPPAAETQTNPSNTSGSMNTTGTPGATGNATLDGAMNEARNAAAGVTAAASDQAAAARTQAEGAATTASENASAAGNTLVAEAQALFTRAQTAIGSANFDEAGKYVEQLKGMRERLPAEWQTRIDQLAQSFTDAKAKLGNALPAGVMPR